MGIWGNLSSCKKGVKPPFQLSGELRNALELKQGNCASLQDVLGNMGFLSCSGKLGVLPELQWESQGTSRFASGESGFLSIC